MKNIKEQMVFMGYPKPFVRLQKSEKSVNMPYLHFHEGYEIYIMVDDGIVEIYSNGKKAVLKKGNVCVIPSFTPHRTSYHSAAVRHIVFDSSYIEKYISNESIKKLHEGYPALYCFFYPEYKFIFIKACAVCYKIQACV